MRDVAVFLIHELSAVSYPANNCQLTAISQLTALGGGGLRGTWKRDDPGHAPAFANRQDGWQRDRRGRSPERWLEE